MVSILKKTISFTSMRKIPKLYRQTLSTTFEGLSSVERGFRHAIKRLRKSEWFYLVNVLDGIFTETMYATASVLLFPLGLFSWNGGWSMPFVRRNVADNSNGSKRPVLLLHGFFHNLSGYFYFSQKLRQKGWNNIYTLNMKTYTQPIESMARQVRDVVNDIIKNSRYRKVDIIGHSLGGLVGRYYVQKLGGHKSVANLITLASPNWGTELARFGFGPSVKQMRPQSKFLEKINTDLSRLRDVNYTSIWSPFDALVVPPSNSILKGAGRNIRVDFVGHIGMLYSDRVFRLLCNLLSRKPH